ncbi:hypothetical protein B0H12DRAFT_1123353 [Mycena haematopus]|nr:hypothetical protein B0H12DRAFT_1123353 [Mycena haematopus]
MLLMLAFSAMSLYIFFSCTDISSGMSRSLGIFLQLAKSNDASRGKSGPAMDFIGAIGRKWRSREYEEDLV